MNRKGSGRLNLTPDLKVVSFDLSPDEQKIALSADTPGARDIYLLHLDSRKIEKLAGGKGPEADPRWSPDGRLIAFTRRAIWGAQADIYVMDADGQHQTRITHSPRDDLAPAWRPARR
jgi:Tol biopolymer transport system component